MRRALYAVARVLPPRVVDILRRTLLCFFVVEGFGPLVPRRTDEPYMVYVKPYARMPLWLRPRTSDVRALWDATSESYHVPPDELVAGGVRYVLDLGANIGVTMLHYALLFPDAEIVGVELDSGNAALARRNVSAFGDRCRVIRGAIWPIDGEIQYDMPRRSQVNASAGAGPLKSPALSLNTLLEDVECVDFLKMDIEGAERQVLRENVEWSSKVRAIKVEAHPPYSVEDCVSDLRALGFKAWRQTVEWNEVVGRRQE